MGISASARARELGVANTIASVGAFSVGPPIGRSHLRYPLAAMRDLQRVPKPIGGILIFEPAAGLLGLTATGPRLRKSARSDRRPIHPELQHLLDWPDDPIDLPAFNLDRLNKSLNRSKIQPFLWDGFDSEHETSLCFLTKPRS